MLIPTHQKIRRCASKWYTFFLLTKKPIYLSLCQAKVKGNLVVYHLMLFYSNSSPLPFPKRTHLSPLQTHIAVFLTATVDRQPPRRRRHLTAFSAVDRFNHHSLLFLTLITVSKIKPQPTYLSSNVLFEAKSHFLNLFHYSTMKYTKSNGKIQKNCMHCCEDLPPICNLEMKHNSNMA